MKKPKAPKLVTVSMFTTVTIIFWVFFSLYNILVSKPVVDISNDILDPIDPTLNTIVLDSIPLRTFVSEGEAPTIFIPTPTPLPVEEVTPNASPEATLTPGLTEGL